MDYQAVIRVSDWLRTEYRESGNQWMVPTLIALTTDLNESLRLKLNVPQVRQVLDSIPLPAPSLKQAASQTVSKNFTRAKLRKLEDAVLDLYKQLKLEPPNLDVIVTDTPDGRPKQ